jgi:hypothetical protein
MAYDTLLFRTFDLDGTYSTEESHLDDRNHAIHAAIPSMMSDQRPLGEGTDQEFSVRMAST